MNINKDTVVTKLNKNSIYGVDSLDGVYYILPEVSLKENDFLLYEHEGLLDIFKVSSINEKEETQQEKVWDEIYRKRIWGNTFNNNENIVTLRRQKNIQLEKSNDETFDKGKHFYVILNDEKIMIDLDGRLSKNQTVIFNKKAFKVSDVKKQTATLEIFPTIYTKGLYSVDFEDGSTLITDDWSTSFDANLERKKQFEKLKKNAS